MLVHGYDSREAKMANVANHSKKKVCYYYDGEQVLHNAICTNLHVLHSLICHVLNMRV